MAETQILDYLVRENRPFNVQLVADMMAQFGQKKPSVQRALEVLVEEGKISSKEFGKTKLYFARQEAPSANEKEEIDIMMTKTQELQEQAKKQGAEVQMLQKEMQMFQSTLTDAEIVERIQSLQEQVNAADIRLQALHGKSSLISRADWEATEKACSTNVMLWAKRRRIFQDIWSLISENIDSNHKQFLEDLGVETDEVHDLMVSEFQQLVAKRPRR